MRTNLVKLSLALVIASLSACTDRAPDAPAAAPAAAQVPQASNAEPVTPSAYDVAPVTPGGNCALDAVHGAPAAGATARAGAEVVFSGWVADQTNQVPAEARLVFRGVDRAYSAPLVAGGLRPDVAAALNAEALGTSGYNALVKLDLAPGTYGLSIGHGPLGQAQECPIASTLVVTE